MIDYTRLTPQQLAAAKNKEQNDVVRSIYHKEGLEDGKREEKKDVALNAINEGLNDSLIVKLTGLTIEQVQQIRDSR